MLKALYPELDPLQRELDLHTCGEKIKTLYFAMEKAKIHKSEGMLLQYSGALTVKLLN